MCYGKDQQYLFLLCIIFLLTMSVVESQRTNIALNKLTKQSSTVTSVPKCDSFYANDGNRGQSRGEDGCSTTETNEAFYWWAVNLGDIFIIDAVTIYNRLGSFSERLYNYSILVHHPDVSSWSSFTSSPGELCYFHKGESPSILSVTCRENVYGQYVQIYKDNRVIETMADALTLCEVEIYTDVKVTRTRKVQYCNLPNRIPYQYIDIQQPKTSMVNCASMCSQTERCLGYAMTYDGTCSLAQASEDGYFNTMYKVYFEKC